MGIPPHRLAPWCVVKIRTKFQKVPVPSRSQQLWFAPLSVSGGNWCSCPFAVIHRLQSSRLVRVMVIDRMGPAP